MRRYTSFAYSGLALATQSVRPCDTIKLTVTVRNVGAVDSDEVVQAYVKHPHASVPVPQVRLAAFERVHIAAGSSATVALSIPPSAHSVVTSSTRGESVYNASGSQRVEAGRVEIFVGGGSAGLLRGARGRGGDGVGGCCPDELRLAGLSACCKLASVNKKTAS